MHQTQSLLVAAEMQARPNTLMGHGPGPLPSCLQQLDKAAGVRFSMCGPNADVQTLSAKTYGVCSRAAKSQVCMSIPCVLHHVMSMLMVLMTVLRTRLLVLLVEHP
jgi:hypothetical protein